VAVEMAAFAVVVHETMAVAEFDGFGDFIHESLRSVDNDLIILKAVDTVNRFENPPAGSRPQMNDGSVCGLGLLP
jgi:hypothetical protein